MVVASCALQFWQEYGSNNAVIKLQASISAVAQVRRQMPDASGDLRPGHVGVPSIDLVPGDILRISPGDSVPADCMLVQSSSLQVSESSLTGETDAVKKTANAIPNKEDIGPVDMENVLFAGTTIVSGSGEAVAVRTGDSKIGPMFPIVKYRDAVPKVLICHLQMSSSPALRKQPIRNNHQILSSGASERSPI